MVAQSIYRSAAGEQAIMALYDQALARWPVPYTTGTVATRHGDAFVITCGDEQAPPLVLLHGAGVNATMWGGDVTVYSRHFHIYAVDLPGEPGKSAPNRLPWTGPAYVEWLSDVFAGLDIETATVLGLSQGAWTALKFATARPQQVARLVLLTPGGIVPDRLSFLVRALPLLLLGRWGARRLMRLLYGSQPIPDGVEEITLVLMSNFRARVGTLPLFADDELRRLIMPTLLLGGDEDALRDLDRIAARLRTLLPDLTVAILPGAGHALLDTGEHVMAFLGAAAGKNEREKVLPVYGRGMTTP